MDLIHFIVFACIVYIAIVLGRMSMKNDMRRRFASIGGLEQKFPDVTTVINYVLKLREQVEKLEHDNQALNNSLKMSNYTSEKLTEDYKKLLEQLKEKRQECEVELINNSTLRDRNKELVERINKSADKFDEWMQKLWEYVSAINDNTIKHHASINEYCDDMDKAGKKQIYVTELLNKSHLLSIGEVEVQKNGSLKYSEGSRSLGNYASTENWGWLNAINRTEALPLMNPRESKPIALIMDDGDYRKLAKEFFDVYKSSNKIINESANMLDYMKEIKNEFPNILYNNK